MTLPSIETIYEVVDGTWPAASYANVGPWTIREGRGGGQRVSAATARQPVRADELALAEKAMTKLGQPNLFMIREGEAELDAMLDDAGYVVHDPVSAYACEIGLLTEERPPRVSALLAWEPLAIMLDIWNAGGIGPGRIEVMHRAKGPKMGLVGRLNDHPAAAGFCAIHKGIAMVHALEVLPHQRRQNMGRYAMQEFAHWARKEGATHMSLVTTRANEGANALYTSLGMTCVGQYHYRLKKEKTS